MSDLRRYEEALAKRLKGKSLPDKNSDLVWQKIEGLLDKDDKKPVAALPQNRTKIILLVLLLSLILIGILWFTHSQTPDSTVAKTNNDKPATNNENTEKGISSLEKNNTMPAGLINKKKDNIQLQNEKVIPEGKNLKTSKRLTIESEQEDNYRKNDKNNNGRRPRVRINKKSKTSFNTIDAEVGDGQQDSTKSTGAKSVDSNEPEITQKTIIALTADTLEKKNKKPVTTIVKPTNADSVIAAKKKKKSHWAAGIAVQQAFNLDCNCLYTTSAYTANIKASDYLPSAYIRFYHQQKWFLQAEGKYAAAQYIDAFTYKINVQDIPYHDVVTSYTLKKLYSNQLEASFHYFILPNLSFGSGIIYNLFSGADIQKAVYRKQYESATDSLIGSITINDNEDSNFNSRMKNDFQWLLETQYKWKHFSIGLNYAIGLTPYIKYTDPFSGLVIQREKSALNIFIRYELWKSRLK